jgi:S-adenosyl-L-methionine hydrolase (adenosine-forming)
MKPIVTLLSDFGWKDSYVGAMKGVILTRAPETQVIDITHEVPRHQVRAGAWILKEVVPLFPPGTIHLAVVDPGVGTSRRPLLIETALGLFVGPDNGLFSWIPQASTAIARGLDADRFHRLPVSPTFHGRDVFASVVGHLAAGVAPNELGTTLADWKRIPEPRLVVGPEESLGEVVVVDGFGNLVSNVAVPPEAWGRGQRVWVRGHDCGLLLRTYGDVEPGQWVSYVGSAGTVEVAVRHGSAAEQGGFREGDEVRLCSAES